MTDPVPPAVVLTRRCASAGSRTSRPAPEPAGPGRTAPERRDGSLTFRSMTAPEPSSGVAEFGLDLDKARDAVVALREVYDQLTELRSLAVNVARGPRTATDSVSVEAFDLLAHMAVGGPGSLAAAINGAQKHVEELIVQMEADIAAQEQIDADAAREIART